MTTRHKAKRLLLVGLALGALATSVLVAPGGAGAASLTVSPVTPTAAAAPASANSTDIYGCPSGDVCLYTDNTDTIGPTHPHTNYSAYGYDNLSNVNGGHYLDNHQTGGAVVYPCKGYGGTNCTVDITSPINGSTIHYVPAGYETNLDFTPINSLKLCAAVGC